MSVLVSIDPCHRLGLSELSFRPGDSRRFGEAECVLSKKIEKKRMCYIHFDVIFHISYINIYKKRVVLSIAVQILLIKILNNYSGL